VSYKGDSIIITATNFTIEDVSYSVTFAGEMDKDDVSGSLLTGTLTSGELGIELSYNVINNISGEFIFTISGEADTDLSLAVTVKEPFIVSSDNTISYVNDTVMITATIKVTNNTRFDTSYNVTVSNGVSESIFASGTVFSGNLDVGISEIELSYIPTTNVSGDFVFSISGDYTDISVNVEVVEPLSLSRSHAVSYRGDTIIITASNLTREDVSYSVTFAGAMKAIDVSGSLLTGTLTSVELGKELSYHIRNIKKYFYNKI